MKIPSEKICDLCKKTIAIKSGLLYHTKRSFVTIRTDDPGRYVNVLEHTTKGKMHFCYPCFLEISVQAEQALKEREQSDR